MNGIDELWYFLSILHQLEWQSCYHWNNSYNTATRKRNNTSKEKQFADGISTSIRAGTRQDGPGADGPGADAPATARSLLSIDQTQQPELDIPLNGGPLAADSALMALVHLQMIYAWTRGSGVSVVPQQLIDAQMMGQLTVAVVNACNLPIVDRDGACDPYVEITVNGVTQNRSTLYLVTV